MALHLIDICNFQVNYLSYLGTTNVSDAAALYLKMSFTVNEDLTNNVTWLGSVKNKITGLKQTRFAAACEGIYSKFYIIIILNLC